jgi:hypothetical protein
VAMKLLGRPGIRRACCPDANCRKTELSGCRDDLIRKQLTEATDISIRARGPCRFGCDNHCQLKRRHDVDQLTAIAAFPSVPTLTLRTLSVSPEP